MPFYRRRTTVRRRAVRRRAAPRASLARAVGRVLDRRAEHKYYIYSADVTNITGYNYAADLGGWFVDLTSLIQPGVEYYQRIGKQIRVKSINIRMRMGATGLGETFGGYKTFLRTLLFSTDGDQTYRDVAAEAGGINDTTHLDMAPIKRIYYDKVRTFVGANSTAASLTLSKRMNTVVKYASDASSPPDNQRIWLGWVSEAAHTTTVNNPIVTVHAKIVWTDV